MPDPKKVITKRMALTKDQALWAFSKYQKGYFIEQIAKALYVNPSTLWKIFHMN